MSIKHLDEWVSLLRKRFRSGDEVNLELLLQRYEELRDQRPDAAAAKLREEECVAERLSVLREALVVVGDYHGGGTLRCLIDSYQLQELRKQMLAQRLEADLAWERGDRVASKKCLALASEVEGRVFAAVEYESRRRQKAAG